MTKNKTKINELINKLYNKSLNKNISLKEYFLLEKAIRHLKKFRDA